ncbi:helix-turn-helix domain-containing protein [Carboxydichorda subterranea]|uniref:helix-turn-helix domain-containing protein n=1 Tax=Carboxydichorda subterranea TaxID=3109565 RepID=UPI0038579A95
MQEAARLLRTHPHFLYRLIRQGRLPALRLGRAIRLSEDVLRRMLESREQEGVSRNG